MGGKVTYTRRLSLPTKNSQYDYEVLTAEFGYGAEGDDHRTANEAMAAARELVARSTTAALMKGRGHDHGTGEIEE
jgi:hypothetical protein